MAQTIAVQRGSTTVAGNGATKVTLFTQSSGIATRVILVGVSADITASNSVSIGLFININGSGNYVPVAYAMGNFSAYNSIYMMPDKANNSPFMMQTGATGITAGTAALVSNGAGGLVSNLSNGQVALAGSTGYQSPYYNSPLSLVPSQFWMANGDSLVASSYNSSSNTATILYHFVTVTES